MTNFDFTPLYKTTVGFDHMANLLDNFVNRSGDVASYPPYNIERFDENNYRITMAVAGFGEDEIDIEVKENGLSVRGEQKEADQASEYLHRGIAARSFERRFQLADYVEVVGAELVNGLLHITLKRELPEKMLPRKIAIGKKAKPKQIKAK